MEDAPDHDFTREPIGRFEWERIVRRAVIKPPSAKFLGLMMATYASADGSRVRPGRDRLAAVMGTSMSVVDRGQRSLEKLGFLDKVYKGHGAGRGRKGGFASEFQLTVPSDLAHVPMLDQDESHSSPVTTSSENHSPVVTTGNPEPLVNPKEPLVRIAEPLVNSAEPLSASDTPPLHSHHINNHYIKHQAGDVTLGDAHASDALPASSWSENENDDYQEASKYLQGLPDVGQSHMEAVNEYTPDAPLKTRVIAAALAAGWKNTETRKAS